MLSRVILLVITSGCVAINVNAAESPEETSIREILSAQVDAWNRGDGVAWAKEFTDDADFVNLRGSVLHGRGDIGAGVAASLHARMKGSRISVVIRQFRLLSPDVALIETDYEHSGIEGGLPGVATAGRTLKTRMKYVAVRRAKQWCFIAAQNTPILPAVSKGR